MNGDSPNDIDLSRLARQLEALSRQPGACEGSPEGQAVLRAAAQLLSGVRRRTQKAVRQRDRDLLAGARIRTSEPALGVGELHRPRRCYVCGQPFTRTHWFYDSLCPSCGDDSHARRQQSADLSGRFALVTGGRVRIGFRVALKLLRAGAVVLATTRFPHDAARRYAAEPDASSWADRLHVRGLDLRALGAAEAFAEEVDRSFPHLDILVNNAAQTVRRPPAYYRALVEQERAGLEALPPLARPWVQGTAALASGGLTPVAYAPGSPAGEGVLPWSAALTQVPLAPGDEGTPEEEHALFPAGALDEEGQPLDLRAVNSWALSLTDVSPVELVEVHAVNCLAPFLLLRRLVSVLARSPFPARFVVNVAAREGWFTAGRDGRHPHTNMAKAALNMLTRTAADDLATRGIYVNSVDPGWVSHQGSAQRVRQLEDEGVRVPLDAEDGAARVCAPVFEGLRTGQPEWGKLFKDYRVTPW